MWDWNFALSIIPEILLSLKITILATLSGFFIALILGLILIVGIRVNFKPISVFVTVFIQFIRNTPLLVQLYFIFYVLPKQGIVLTPFIAGVIGLGIHYSTYLSEVYRSGIEAIPKGQWEAGKALNFTPLQIWSKIIIPQVIPLIIPIMGNYLITMFKDTPILSAITLVEILQTAKSIGAQSFRYLESFTIVGILFLLLSYPCSLLVHNLENRFNKKYSLD